MHRRGAPRRSWPRGRPAAHLVELAISGGPDLAVLGLVQAFALVTLIASLGVPCGAYVKAAITIAMLGARRVRLAEVCAKVAVQIAGAVVGALLVKTLMTRAGLAWACGCGPAGDWLLASVAWPVAGAVVAARAHAWLLVATRRRRAARTPARSGDPRGRPRPRRAAAVQELMGAVLGPDRQHRPEYAPDEISEIAQRLRRQADFVGDDEGRRAA